MDAAARNDPSATRLLDRVTLHLALLALFAGFAQFGAVASLADVARHFGHVSPTGSLSARVGLSSSVLGLGLAVLRLASLGALPLASLADRWGRRRLLRDTLLVGLAVTAAAALSPSYWIFVACFALGRPLLSTASALLQVVTVELAGARLRVGRLAVVAAGSGAGSGLSAIVHGLIRSPSAFRWLFALAVLPAFGVAWLLRRVPEPPSRDETVLARLGRIDPEFRGRLWRVAAVVGALGLIAGPANGFVFVYGESVLHVAPSRVALMVTSASVTGLAGLLASRHLAQRWGRWRTVSLGLAVSALAATAAYGGNVTLFVAGYLLGVGAGGLVTPVLTALGTEIFPHHLRATAAGWLAVAGIVGATAGLGVFGWVGDAMHQSGPAALRWPAVVTFLPLAWTGLALRRLPDRSGAEIA